MWPDERGPEEAADRKEMAAEVDWFGEALNSKEDIATDLTDPRYPLAGAMKPLADWCAVVDSASWNNQDWALGLWHVLLGQVLRDQRIHVGRESFDGRFSLLILAPSGTGKTRSTNPLRELFPQVSRWVYDANSHHYDKKHFEIRPMLEATTAALVGGSETKKGVKVPTPGLLETADLVHWDEAEALFHETSYNTNMLRTFNMAMNPIGSPGNVVVKELAGISNVVYPKCSLLMTAVDFYAIPEEVLRNGFYQRIGVMRKQITPDQRKANRRKEKHFADSGVTTDPEMLRTRDYLNELAEFYKIPQKWNFTHVSGMLLNKFDQMVDAAGANDQVRPFLEDFAERYMDKLRILAMHYAAMRCFNRGGIAAGTYYVEVEDVARAWVVVKTCMKQFFTYVMEIAHMWKYASEKAARRRYLESRGIKP